MVSIPIVAAAAGKGSDPAPQITGAVDKIRIPEGVRIFFFHGGIFAKDMYITNKEFQSSSPRSRSAKKDRAVDRWIVFQKRHSGVQNAMD